MVIQVNIDLAKVDKTKIKEFKRKDGTVGKGYDLVIFLKDEADQYGNNGFIAESTPKDSQVKGTILGQVRIAGGQKAQATATPPPPTDEASDLPF